MGVTVGVESDFGARSPACTANVSNDLLVSFLIRSSQTHQLYPMSRFPTTALDSQLWSHACFSKNTFSASSIPTSCSIERWIMGSINFDWTLNRRLRTVPSPSDSDLDIC
jgi:hypothetical protein